MAPHFRTLRFKLTAYFTVIFGLAQILIWIIVQLVVASHLHQRLDMELRQRGQGLAEAIIDEQKRQPTISFGDAAAAVINPFESDNVYVQVRSANLKETVKSQNLQGLSLPPPAPSTPERTPDWRTIEGDVAQSIRDGGGGLRLLTLDIDGADHRRFYVQIATSLAPVDRTILEIQQLLIVFIIVSLLIATVASWAVAGRSLAPLRHIAREARRLSAAHLERRIPAPRTEDEVADMIGAINFMLSRLEDQFKNQQRFISNVAHELKTPLAVLLVEIETSRKRGVHSPQVEALFESTEEEVRRLLRMVEGFLILTRSSNARRLETVTGVSIEEVVIAAIQDCAKPAREHGVHVVPRFPAGETVAEPVVTGDADLLVAMVENLLSNAIRHSPNGGTVEVTVDCTPKEVQICVRDQGPGIPEEHHRRIFEMFYQLPTPTGKGGKAGIGLAIVKTVVELHGGTVSLRNLDGRGLEFSILLPLASSGLPPILPAPSRVS